jgi:hypothetical protein
VLNAHSPGRRIAPASRSIEQPRIVQLYRRRAKGAPPDSWVSHDS